MGAVSLTSGKYLSPGPGTPLQVVTGAETSRVYPASVWILGDGQTLQLGKAREGDRR